MEHISQTPNFTTSKTTPKDFFLWLGAIIALYGSVTSFIALLFEYINYTFPDALASYGDPYGGAVRLSMAALIVLVPTTIVLLHLIRGTIVVEAGKAIIWVRRWALVLTLFIATVTVLIDLVTLINTFLGGEITIRFGLKVAVVLLVAVGVFLHFLADLKGYWIANVKKGNMVGIAVGILAVATVVAGFFIIGTPSHVRDLRLDSQRVSDLQSIQSQVTYYYQQKQKLPKSLSDLTDPLANFIVPVDPETSAAYSYTSTSTLSFSLCATFKAASSDQKGRGGVGPTNMTYPSMGIDMGGISDNWQHTTGQACFTRTIDPQKFPSTIPGPKPF